MSRCHIEATDHGKARPTRLAGGYDPPSSALLTPPGPPGDPLYAVWANVTN